MSASDIMRDWLLGKLALKSLPEGKRRELEIQHELFLTAISPASTENRNLPAVTAPTPVVQTATGVDSSAFLQFLELQQRYLNQKSAPASVVGEEKKREGETPVAAATQPSSGIDGFSVFPAETRERLAFLNAALDPKLTPNLDEKARTRLVRDGYTTKFGKEAADAIFGKNGKVKNVAPAGEPASRSEAKRAVRGGGDEDVQDAKRPRSVRFDEREVLKDLGVDEDSPVEQDLGGVDETQ